MHLAYMDDSGTRDKNNPFQVMATLLIEDKNFLTLEVRSNLIAETIVPEDKREQFEEFHAHELYGGRGVFENVPQEKRFKTITPLLNSIKRTGSILLYTAVNKSILAQKSYASADPVDIGFRGCMMAVEGWLAKQEPENQNLVLLIADDCDKDIKKRLRASFRSLRQPLRQAIFPSGQAWHFHDDMYFGDSKESIGIQTADLCAFFIAKHLKGDDPAAEGFYEIIKDNIVYSKVEPDGNDGKS